MDIKIEQNIPIPTNTINKYESKAKLMDIGDSVFFHADPKDLNRHHDYNGFTRSKAMNLTNALRKLNKKGTMRIFRDEDHKLLGFRVWRIK